MPTRPVFREPRADQPHAVVTITRDYVTEPGPYNDGTVHINGLDVAVGDQSTSAVRVPPGTAHWFVATRFFHNEMRRVQEFVDYTTSEYDSCAYHDSRGNCQGGTRTVTRSRLEWVTRLVEVQDAACDVSKSYELSDRKSYRLSFTFQADKACSIACLDVSDPSRGVECTPFAAPAPVAPGAPPSRVPPSPPAPQTVTSRPWQTLGVVTLAAGGTALGAGAIAGLFAQTQKGVVERHCDATDVCDEAGLTAARNGRTAITVANASVIGGGVLVLAGLSMILFGPSKTVTVSPTTGGAQLGVGGTF